MFDSVSSSAIKSALDGLAARQRATADNIANLNTPDYIASNVDFEDALRSAVADGSGVAGTTTTRSTVAPGLDGNNVNLDVETLTSTDTQLRYQLMSQAESNRFTELSEAVK